MSARNGSFALVVCAGEESSARIAAWVESDGFRAVAAADAASAREALALREFELAVINAPVGGEDGEALALDCAARGAGVLLLVQKGGADELGRRLSSRGIAVLERPISRALFSQGLRLMDASRRHAEIRQGEVERLRAELDETKLVDRAKCVLIQYLGMSEKEAHRYIEKQAMDMRMRRREIAENILKTYES